MHLDELGIAAPCAQTLDSMQSTRDPAARFCESCKERVVDLSRLTRRQAELVLRRGECVSVAHDDDGQVLFRPERRGLPLFPAALRAAAVAAPLWLMGCKEESAAGTATEEVAPIEPEQATLPLASAEEPEPECELEALAPTAASGAATPASASASGKPLVARPPHPHPHPPRLGGKPMYRPNDARGR